MPQAFADTSYYIALLSPDDDLRSGALEQGSAISSWTLFTTDSIFVELLAFASGRGSTVRAAAVEFVRTVNKSSQTTVLQQTRELFDSALDLYEQRIDKRYSLTDCMSMIVCREQKISDVLTHDHHFAQEGFTILL